MEKVDLHFTTLKFYEDYVISHVRNDVILDLTHLEELVDICGSYFQDQDFVYISKRQNHYNVNPIIYLKLKNLNNLMGIGVICENPKDAVTAEFEKNFSPIPFKIFDSEASALKWAKKMLKK